MFRGITATTATKTAANVVGQSILGRILFTNVTRTSFVVAPSSPSTSFHSQFSHLPLTLFSLPKHEHEPRLGESGIRDPESGLFPVFQLASSRYFHWLFFPENRTRNVDRSWPVLSPVRFSLCNCRTCDFFYSGACALQQSSSRADRRWARVGPFTFRERGGKSRFRLSDRNLNVASN